MLLLENYIEPKKIVTELDKELRRIKTKFLHAGFPVTFINHAFSYSTKKKKNC